MRPAGRDKFLKPFSGTVAKDSFPVALRFDALGRVEAVQANAGAIVQSDRVAVSDRKALRLKLASYPDHVIRGGRGGLRCDSKRENYGKHFLDAFIMISIYVSAMET